MATRRIIFVGMHNKPGMLPLDSRTKSGKLIDKIVEQLPIDSNSIVKSNLSDTDYLPDKRETEEQASMWCYVFSPQHDDIVVLLGGWVCDHFPSQYVSSEIVKINHPASATYGTKRAETFIDAAVKKITEKLKELA